MGRKRPVDDTAREMATRAQKRRDRAAKKLAEERRQWHTVDQALRNIWSAMAVSGITILISILFSQHG